jgi:predicted NUDIX family NTP pyrophosphohydrolase
MQAELVWPPRSGKVLRVPEIDRVIWARPAEARQRMHPAQAAFVDRLLERLPGLDDPDTAGS